jgi:hypothetical protein
MALVVQHAPLSHLGHSHRAVQSHWSHRCRNACHKDLHCIFRTCVGLFLYMSQEAAMHHHWAVVLPLIASGVSPSTRRSWMSLSCCLCRLLARVLALCGSTVRVASYKWSTFGGLGRFDGTWAWRLPFLFDSRRTLSSLSFEAKHSSHFCCRIYFTDCLGYSESPVSWSVTARMTAH